MVKPVITYSASVADQAIHAFVTFFVAIGPIDIAALFMALAAGTDCRERRRMAVRGTALSALILIGFALCGDALLRALGIGIPAFRFAGGTLLMLLAIDMVFARHSGLSGLTPLEDQEADQRQDLSVFPLAVPLIAGPGAIASTILLMSEVRGDIAGQAIVLIMLGVVLSLTLWALLIANQIVRLFGVTGVNVITRILGIVLAALAAQYLLDGLQASGALAEGTGAVISWPFAEG